MHPSIDRMRRRLRVMQRRQPFWAIALAVLVSWLLIGILPVVWLKLIGQPNAIAFAAQLGDSYGFVNSLASTVALVGVVLAIVMQGKQLSMQREELQLQRKEVKRSADAQQAQASNLHLSALMTALPVILDLSHAKITNSVRQDLETEHARLNTVLIEAILDRALRDLDDTIGDVLPNWVPLDESTHFGSIDTLVTMHIEFLHGVMKRDRAWNPGVRLDDTGSDPEYWAFVMKWIKNKAGECSSSLGELLAEHDIPSDVIAACAGSVAPLLDMIQQQADIAINSYEQGRDGIEARKELEKQFKSLHEEFARLVELARHETLRRAN